ncbi:MAG: hypothetical protein HC817_08050 [Saprospiraceae bacterium]|nr:hypothetical protein [Saprospiraceae bacterium]
MSAHKSIGGFFELELPSKGAIYHENAIALANGRVCFKVILLEKKPTHVYLPFYSCDSLLEPLNDLNIPYTYYFLDENLEPIKDFEVKNTELMLRINHFGLQNSENTKPALMGVVWDNTQAFFDKPTDGKNWHFNSARKFFGVPDGGFLYAPAHFSLDKYKKIKENTPKTEHLWLRLIGKQADAYAAYQENEAAQNADLAQMSDFSTQILRGVSFEKVAEKRRENFQKLHAALSHLNILSPKITTLAASKVPFCYPLLLDFEIDKTIFYKQNIFIPTLWTDVLTRKTKQKTQKTPHFEEKLVKNLLPLPIDQRLNDDDLARLTQSILVLNP